MRARTQKGGRVLFGLVALAAAVLGVFGYGYWRLVHYSRCAADHLPAGTTFAVRLDVEQVVLFEPLRRNLFPVFSDELSEDASSGVTQRLRDATGVNAAMDLREVLFAVGPEDRWTFVVGGLFPDGVLVGFASVLQAEGVKSCALRGERLHCSAPELWAAQAEDRAVIVASSETQLEQALPRTQTRHALGFPLVGAGALVATREQFGPWLANPLLGLAPGVSTLRQIQRVNADLRLEENAKVRVKLVPGPGVDTNALQAGGDQLLATLQLLSSLVPGDGMLGGRPLLSRAVVSVEADSLVFESHYTQTELDLTARAVAGLLRVWLAPTR